MTHRSFFGQAVEGRLLTDFLLEGDKERFLAIIGTAQDSPACLPFTLKLGAGVQDVHLIVVKVASVLGRCKYPLGIRAEKEQLQPAGDIDAPDFMLVARSQNGERPPP